MNKTLKQVPKFRSEAAERKFWKTHNTNEYFDQTKAVHAALDLLRVDGGAAANDWLMQFQADVLGTAVERPDVVETTALGAAGLAGMALGMWHSAGEFQQGRHYTRFTPQWNSTERERQRAVWQRAISATLYWARQGR